MSRLVLILPDLFIAEDASAAPAEDLPAFAQLLRFATPRPLKEDWRAWLCRAVGRDDLAAASAAALAAGALGEIRGRAEPVWLAEPVHLEAGLSHVRLAPRGLLELEEAERSALLADFGTAFAGTGLELHRHPSRAFLLSGLQLSATRGDPARQLGRDLRDSLLHEDSAAPLRRLGSEIEMWLHGHAVNEARARRGAPRISALWIWGGGVPRGEPASRAVPAGFGSEPSFAGLWSLCGRGLEPLPATLEQLSQGPAGDAFVVLYVSLLAEGLLALERDWMAPGWEALRRKDLAHVTLIANDRVFELRASDRRKLWRRARSWAEALQ